MIESNSLDGKGLSVFKLVIYTFDFPSDRIISLKWKFSISIGANEKVNTLDINLTSEVKKV